MQKGMTVREAAHRWGDEMDAIQQGMIAKLMQYEPDDWEEVTKPSTGDRVWAYDYGNGTVHDIMHTEDSKDIYVVELDEGHTAFVELEEDDFEVEYDSVLPMWGTMWSFRNICDCDWVNEEDGIAVLSRCGFRVYRSEEFGIFFGIDGAGYDFYGDIWRDGQGKICSEGHWIPLYLARGLHWHDPDTIPTKEAC